MENKEAKFKDAQLGDKVYDILWGEGTITRIIYGEKYPIYVIFKEGGTAFYTIKGFQSGLELTQRLYWSKPTIIEQKRKVTKNIEVWANIYKHGCEFIYPTIEGAPTIEEADRFKTDNRIACVKLTGTYEVEE